MKILKVWGGYEKYRSSGDTRTLVAAYSKKQAIEMLRYSNSYFSKYWAETGNDKELATASEVGVYVFVNGFFKKLRQEEK